MKSDPSCVLRLETILQLGIAFLRHRRIGTVAAPVAAAKTTADMKSFGENQQAAFYFVMVDGQSLGQFGDGGGGHDGPFQILAKWATTLILTTDLKSCLAPFLHNQPPGS